MKNAEYKQVPVASLKNWQANPRALMAEDLDRLIEQIKRLGVYKPLLSTADGTIIGGNMRLHALKQMGVETVWVSVVDAPDEKTMLEYALSDNDHVGSYEDTKLHELVLSVPDFPLDLYKVDLGVGKLLRDLINPPDMPAGNQTEPEVADGFTVVVHVPRGEWPEMEPEMNALAEKYGATLDIS